MPGPGIPSPGRRTCSHSTTFAVLNPNVQLQPCMSAFMPGKNVNKHQKGGASFERGGGALPGIYWWKLRVRVIAEGWPPPDGEMEWKHYQAAGATWLSGLETHSQTTI